MVLLFIRAPFYVLLGFIAMCSVFWLFWLSYQYLSGDWLERLLWGTLIVARGSSPESPGWRPRMIFLVYSIASLFYYLLLFHCICVVSCPYVTYFPTVMALYSLFLLKVPLNPKQTDWPGAAVFSTVTFGQIRPRSRWVGSESHRKFSGTAGWYDRFACKSHWMRGIHLRGQPCHLPRPKYLRHECSCTIRLQQQTFSCLVVG